MDAIIDPLFFFFPNLERHHLWMFPKRVEIHNELEIFLDMMREIIIKKRKTLAKQKNLTVSDSTVQNTLSKSTEKDILTLLIESSNTEENSDLSITNDDMLLVSIYYFFQF